MNPGQVIEEVNAEVNNYEAGIHAPKYWDDERERVEFGVVRLQSSIAEPVRYVFIRALTTGHAALPTSAGHPRGRRRMYGSLPRSLDHSSVASIRGD